MKAKTRNLGTMTESQYWGLVRSSLRRSFRYYLPIKAAKIAARQKYTGPNKRQKWTYTCASCLSLFKEKEIGVDHIAAVGSLKRGEDLQGFLERLTTEDPNGYQCLCKSCHQIKTNLERGLA